MKRYFEDDILGSFNGEWFNFFFDLGESIALNEKKNVKYILLTPTATIIPFVLASGAINGFLQGKISTGFKELREIWEDLQQTELGSEIHVIKQSSKGLIKHTGALSSINEDQFQIEETLDNIKNPNHGWLKNTQNIKVSISNKSFDLKEKSQSYGGDLNIKDFNIYYPDVDPLGIMGLPNNLIQIVGNKNTLDKESDLQFFIEHDEGFGRFKFGDLLATQKAIDKEIEVTKLCSTNESQLSRDANLTIFIQSENTNIEHVMDWENDFPQVIIIPRTLRRSTSLISSYNQEYLYRLNDKEITNYPQNIPLGCEIMAYEV